jgi:hypothetical protein
MAGDHADCIWGVVYGNFLQSDLSHERRDHLRALFLVPGRRDNRANTH